MKKTVEAYIAVGSNIQPEKHIPLALEKLKGYVHVKAVSTFYQTEPIGRPEQLYFLNGLWQIETDKTPRELKFKVLRPIESALGRVRTEDKYAPRTIDLDIIIYGSALINEPDLHIPDPDIQKRPFIAVPLLELAPSLILPDTGQHLSSIVTPEAISILKPVSKFTESLRKNVLS